MRERYVGHAFSTVDIDPDEVLGGRGVQDVMAAVIRENSSIASGEVDGASVANADEDCGLGGAGVEVEPFFCL